MVSAGTVSTGHGHPHHHSHGDVDAPNGATHTHVFLGGNHGRNKRKVWAVKALTVATMVVEIVAGTAFGSIALVADGLHLSTYPVAI